MIGLLETVLIHQHVLLFQCHPAFQVSEKGDHHEETARGQTKLCLASLVSFTDGKTVDIKPTDVLNLTSCCRLELGGLRHDQSPTRSTVTTPGHEDHYSVGQQQTLVFINTYHYHVTNVTLSVMSNVQSLCFHQTFLKH